MPYAAGIDRLRLIYQLHLDGLPSANALASTDSDICVWGGSEMSVQLFPDRGTTSSRWPHPADRRTRRDEASCVAVLLPDIDLRPASSLEDLAYAWSLLQPGGLLLGHTRRRFPYRPSSVRARLARQGFTDIELYHVEPHICDPALLFSAEHEAAAREFKRARARNRATSKWSRHLIRSCIELMGLGDFLRPHLFFRARRPC